jgi:hypothetical protein
VGACEPYQRLPLHDEHKILNEAFHRLLRELWRQSGGWFDWDDALFMGIFVPDAAAPQIGKL